MLHKLRDDGYELSSERERIDLPRVHRWISTDAYWAMGRPLEQMRAALAGSQPYGIYARGGEQVAVARVVTDGAVFAYLCDVYVDPAHRGRGLGGWLVEHLRDNYAALGLSRFVLVTRDAHAVYARHGFTEVEPGRWMQCDLRSSAEEQPGQPASANERPDQPASIGERLDEPAPVGERLDQPAPVGERSDLRATVSEQGGARS